MNKNWILVSALINFIFGVINAICGFYGLAVMNYVCSIPAFYFYIKLDVK